LYRYTTTRELEVTSKAMGRLIGFMQEGPHQLFTEQKYMYAFDPYDNVYTVGLVQVQFSLPIALESSWLQPSEPMK
jgi:hypothetical protein